MAIRKSITEDVYVGGAREQIKEAVKTALEVSGFTHIQSFDQMDQITAKYRHFPYYGTIEISLLEESEGRTHLRILVSANIDNIYALFVSPGKKIAEKFKVAFCTITHSQLRQYSVALT